MKRLVVFIFFSLFTIDLFAIEIVRPSVEYKAQGLRDPFRSPVIEEDKIGPGGGRGEQPEVTEAAEEPAQPPALTVQGLIWGGRFPQAIINHKVVKEGDTIEGARIISIDKEGVTVSFELRQYKLSSPAAGG